MTKADSQPPTPQHPDLQDLLDHAGWLRALARRLVRDPDVAEDVVQDAWVAALERPPARDENPRGWLAAVVRNAARMRGRAAGRRAGREARAAAERRGTAPSGDELAERVETQRRLAAMVLELDEPFRRTLLLRYWEGLSPAEIARRTGEPAGTTRWRLSEGLRRLRERLDDDFGGDRAAWTTLILPLALAEREGAAAAGAGGVLTGILAMKLGTKLALGAGVGVLALLVTPFGPAARRLVLGDGGTLPPPVEVTFRPLESERETSVPGDEAGGARRAAAPADEVAAEDPAADAPPSGYRARLVDPKGRPVAGARVWLRNFEEHATKSDRSGHLVLHIPDEELAAPASSRVRIDHPRFAPLTVRSAAEVGRMADLGTLVLTPAGAIEGRVVDASGTPVPGAWVVQTDQPDPGRRVMLVLSAKGVPPDTGAIADAGAIADEGGRFLLERVPVGERHLWAGARGHEAVLSGGVEVRAGEVSSGVRLQLGTLDPEDYITGVVLDPKGNPAPHAELEYEYRSLAGSGSGSRSVDEQGRFRLAYVPAVPRTLRASDRDFGAARVDDVRGGDHVTLRLREREHLTLEVSGEGPLEDLHAWGHDPEQRDVLVRAEEVTWDGPVARVPVPAEPFGLQVRAAGHDVARLGPFDGRAAPRELSVDLDPLPGVRGRVLANGEPVAGARLRLFARAREHTLHDGFPVRVHPEPVAAAESGADGRFALTLREEGEFYLRAESPDHAPAELGPLSLDPRAGRDGLEVTLGPGGVLTGRVVQAGGSAAGSIVAVSRGDAFPRSQRVDAEGRFRFEHLTPGPWHVRLVERELSAWPSETYWPGRPFDPTALPEDCRVRACEVTRFDLVLGERPVLAGRVLVDGNPAQGWEVALGEERGAGAFVEVAETRVGDDGRFELAAPAAGTYRVWLAAPGVAGPSLVASGPFLVEELSLAPGRTRWDLDLKTGRVRIEGVPETPNGEMLLLVAEDGPRTVLAPLVGPDTRTSGSVTLEHVPALPARIVRVTRSEMAAGGDPREAGTTLARLEVRAGEETVVRLPR